MSLPKPPKKPCPSCPYVKNTPSGIWHKDEYAKLPEYDRPTAQQPFGIFMCHQQNGCLCGGWLATHDADHLLALRLQRVDESAYDYDPDVECFSSGQEAYEHGIAGIDNPENS